MVIAFRRHESPYSALTAHLFEIDPAVPYELTESMTYEPGPSVRVMGAKLRAWKIGLTNAPVPSSSNTGPCVANRKYSIDMMTHIHLANRHDGCAIDPKKY